MNQTSPWTGQVAGWYFDQVTAFHAGTGGEEFCSGFHRRVRFRFWTYYCDLTKKRTGLSKSGRVVRLDHRSISSMKVRLKAAGIICRLVHTGSMGPVGVRVRGERCLTPMKLPTVCT